VAAPLRVRLSRSALRILTRWPLVPAIVFAWRRLRRAAHVRRVLATDAAAAAHYRTPWRPVATPARAGDDDARGTPALLTLQNARILAQPVAVLGADWSLVWSAAPQLKRRPATADAAWKRPAPDARRLVGLTLFAAVDGFSYYHWLVGTLPKLLLARRAGLAWTDLDQIVVNPKHKNRTPFQREALALLGVPLDRLVWLDRGLHLACDELVLPSAPCREEQTRLEPWALALLRDAFLDAALAAPAAGEAPRRLFISRARANRRRLANEDAVRALVERHGYTAVHLETLPWLVQLQWLARAEAVVALHGAGLGNLAFCSPGTRVIEIGSSAWPNPCFANLAALAGLRHAAVPGTPVGPRTGFAADVSADLAALECCLRE
jgi:capsular polysaccharide biosynthesis protein